jgi:hypothetical protein
MQQTEQRGDNPLTVATRAFSVDPKYKEYCRQNDGKVSAWIVPDGAIPAPATDGDGTNDAIPGINPSGGGSSSGSSGSYTSPPATAPSSPVGGGYWQPVPPEKHERPEPNWNPIESPEASDNYATVIGQTDTQWLII